MPRLLLGPLFYAYSNNFSNTQVSVQCRTPQRPQAVLQEGKHVRIDPHLKAETCLIF